ncbi:MAG TPA: class I SAM-dependent methyltransferase [Candidatus Angelobacter sp.]|nr:class I SAM-dependent methyltransferase [Candidatus Angelobacter sp.]
MGRYVANKDFPHYFYYYEADLYINGLMKSSKLALELGAGTCGSTLNHASKDQRIVAIDYSRPMLEVGRIKLRSRGLDDNVDILVADVCHLPFRNDSFDTVFSRGVAICYATNPEEFANEARRVLNPSGRLGFDFMNKSAQSKRKITRTDLINGKMYYVEMFTEEGKQKRIGYQLPEAVASSLQTKDSSFSRSLPSTLAGINLETLQKEE